MKTNTTGIVNPINKDDMEEILKGSKETGTLSKKTSRNQTFYAIDLWRMQKKHKTLGSSTRW